MNCPGCGAAMQAVGNRNYFHCDHCGRFEFPCETDAGVVPLGEKSIKDCPVCRASLEKALIEGEDVRYCQTCRGFLCATDVFGRIIHKRLRCTAPTNRSTSPSIRPTSSAGSAARAAPAG